ncbi:MAG: beta-lactamase family protein [Verrucomicrobia bacterium]|nr:beta-lactamase family protein [Verrucomicrobiota bacterium]
MLQSSITISLNFSGIIALKQKNQVVFKKEYGLGSQGRGLGCPPEAIFCIGSLTKMFTATAILLLEERKQLHTNDCIEPFFPECPDAGKMTIHHLLSHTAGLINYTDDEEIWRLRAKKISPAALIKTFIKKPLIFSPGSQYSYSNSGYVLLGSIIEQVSGLSYGTFLKRHIFDPQQMFSTQYSLPIRKKSIQGYSETKGKERIKASFHPPSFAYAAGGIYSTVEDLLLWDERLFKHQILTAESLDKMLQLYCFTNAEKTMGYGYGLNIEYLSGKERSIKHIWHRGKTEGFSSLYSKYLELDTTLIILTNNDQLSEEIKALEKQLITLVG